jgi:hypothetical protein
LSLSNIDPFADKRRFDSADKAGDTKKLLFVLFVFEWSVFDDLSPLPPPAFVAPPPPPLDDDDDASISFMN